jgi:carbon-monoxide dehydrogenase small subunit|tara:strand:- start:12631 stop:13788 length:1158 start_codon:yes stop_codon:yes gene_type:complete
VKTISLTVNGKKHTASVEPRTSLADFLREELLLTGTHLGCEQGVCGACTINLNGNPARSCISYAIACDDANIWTIEGFDKDPLFSDLREAFTSEHGLQCGFCTPGMLVTARDIITRLPEIDDARLRIELSGNLCRCTGYVGIVNAIRKVLDKRLADGSALKAQENLTIDEVPVEVGTTQGKDNKEGHTSKLASVGNMTTLTQKFELKHPRAVVWDMFQNLEQVTNCMPGASLTEAPRDNNIKGGIVIKLGPIRTNFAFEAEVIADASNFTGNIDANGFDKGHSTRARGIINYQLSETETGAATQVDVKVAFALTGTLAQFSRGGIVNAIANRMTQNFASNLEAVMGSTDGSTVDSSPDQAELDMGNVVFSIFWLKIKSVFNSLFR